MAWDIDGDLNPSVKFSIGDEWICVRVASDADNRKFFDLIGVKETVEYKTDSRTRQMQRLTFLELSETQKEKFNEEIWDFSIVEWNLLDKNGDSIPCTRENKIKLMRHSPKFASWVAECLESLREDLKIYREQEKKI